MSFEGELTPAFDLKFLRAGAQRPDGWGLGSYPSTEPSASLIKEPSATAAASNGALEPREQSASSLFMLHVRTALWGALNQANTQPFTRPWGGRQWMFGHSGSLDKRPDLSADPLFEPLGATDSEIVFCELLNRFAERRWRTIGEANPATLAEWLWSFNELGTLNLVLSDGQDLLVYADKRESGLFCWNLLPPFDKLAFGDADVEVDLARRGVISRKAVMIASRVLPTTVDSTQPADWQPIAAGSLWTVRQGVVTNTVSAPGAPPEQTQVPARPQVRLNRPRKSEVKRYDILHRTTYRYTTAVEHSMHLLRMSPMHDRLQSVVAHSLDVSVEGESRDYEDVFGNRVRRIKVEKPFTEMNVVAKSTVELLDTDPLSFRPLRARSAFPLVWMPWHRRVLGPYLQPPELPESELTELSEYAMSFVERNDYDLLDTLMDLNATIFREYKYTQGCTDLSTTAYQVYATRKGVCQDFSNLFICMTRLLGVPARYMCGYVYTGPKNEAHPQSDASHAWVQVYLREVGWRGFDPTNGVLTQTEHVRLATGRNYTDATPTSGTLFAGGGGEELEVEVRLDLHE